MNELILLCCFGIGVVAGLRSMTAPAIVSLAAYFGWLDLSSGPFWFAASPFVAALLTVWALFELVMDKTPKLGNRTGFLGLSFRIITSSACGAAIASAAGRGIIPGIILGLAGGAIGTYGGYHLRKLIDQRTSLGDLPIALAEDLIAITLGLLFVYLPGH